VSGMTPLASSFPLKPLRFMAPLRGEKVDAVPLEGEFLGLEQFESWSGKLSGVELQQPPEGGANIFNKGDVLFGKLRPYLAKGWVAENSGYCTTEGLVLTPSGADPRFVRYCLLTHEVISAVDGSTYGSKMPRADWGFIGGIHLPCPSQDKQERIANFLDDKTARIDALIAEKEQLVALLSESRESVTELAVMPTDGARLKPLKRVTLRIITGPFGSALHSSEYVEGGVPVINPSHIVGNAVCPDQNVSVTQEMANSLSSYWLSPGELIVGRRGEMGRCAVVPVEGKGWLCGTGSLLAAPDTSQVLPDYLQLVVSSRAARDWLSLESVGSTMENLNGEILGRLPGFFPPISDQVERLTRARAALGTHDDLMAHVLEHIARLREYRSSLISAAVTGRLDQGTTTALLSQVSLEALNV